MNDGDLAAALARRRLDLPGVRTLMYRAPTSASGAHQVGELYVDSLGQQFICTAPGTPGTWVKVGAQQ